jgi:hypothetical protein
LCFCLVFFFVCFCFACLFNWKQSHHTFLLCFSDPCSGIWVRVTK